MALFPLILSAYGTVPMGESYTAILVYYLFGLACIAVGLFVSSITESQIIAAVVTFVILFAAYMMTAITSLISQSGNLLTQILNAFNFSSRLEDLLGGTLDFKAVFYFLTVILVFLFLTVQSIQKRRYQISVRSPASLNTSDYLSETDSFWNRMPGGCISARFIFSRKFLPTA